MIEQSQEVLRLIFWRPQLLASIIVKHLDADRCESEGISLGNSERLWFSRANGKQQVSADALTQEDTAPQLTSRLNSHEIGPFVTPSHNTHWFSLGL